MNKTSDVNAYFPKLKHEIILLEPFFPLLEGCSLMISIDDDDMIYWQKYSIDLL